MMMLNLKFSLLEIISVPEMRSPFLRSRSRDPLVLPRES